MGYQKELSAEIISIMSDTERIGHSFTLTSIMCMFDKPRPNRTDVAHCMNDLAKKGIIIRFKEYGKSHYRFVNVNHH